MVTVYEDEKECPFFYFPHFKERLRFKRMVKAEAKENQIRTFCEATRLRSRLIKVAYVTSLGCL